MVLYFDNGITIREIAKVSNQKEALAEITKFCTDRNFVIYYIREWDRENGKLSGKHRVFDVGCHTQFFYLRY